MASLTTVLDRHLQRTPSLLVVLNPNAGRVRPHMATAAARAAAEDCPRLHLTASLDALRELFETIAIDRSQTVCFYGGDGSIARGLSAMLHCLGEDAPLPTVLPVAAGTINVMSEYLGLAEPPAETLARLDAPGQLERRAIPSIKIEVEGHPPIYGFMLGWGVGYRVLESYYSRSDHPTLVDASAVMVQTFGQSLHPRATELPLFRCHGLELCVDGQPLGPEQPACHSLIVGVLERSTMGLRVLPPEPVEAQRFHFSANGMRPAAVFRHARSLLFAHRDQRELEGEHPLVARANARELRFALTEGYTLDGEMIRVEDTRACTISAGPTVHFWAAPSSS
jgi:hypothetical protein